MTSSGAKLMVEDGARLCQNPDPQNTPALASDGAGGMIAVWNDYRFNLLMDIYGTRESSDGVSLWPSTGVPICTANQGQFYPQAVPDGAGGVIVTWLDQRAGSGNDDIYAQRVNANGALQWGTANTGMPVCTALGHQYRPFLVRDGSGGAIITWEDHRFGTDGDIFAQRINAAGASMWGVGGISLTTPLGNQTFGFLLPGETISPIVSDGAGGAIVTWFSGPFNVADNIYAQRISPSGSAVWGTAVCAADGFQRYPSLTTDGAGGAIVTWGDARITQGPAGVYAQRMGAGGAWGNPAPTITSVVDVPGDQGGFVTVRWRESDNAYPIYYYEVYRDDLGTWNIVGVTFETGTMNSLVVPTIADSSCGTPGFGHQFKIRAYGPTVEESNIGYGRSVDNLVPGAPQLSAQLVGNTLTLTWTRSAPDLAGWWTIYSGTQPGGSTCGTTCFYADVYDTTHTISFGLPMADSYWSVRAFDYHCNFGVLSNEVAVLPPNTPVGSFVTVLPVDPETGSAPVQVTFTDVTAEGRTSLEIGRARPPVPGGFEIGDGRYYNLSTTATFSNTIRVCISYDERALTVPEADLRLLHYDESLVPPAWIDITNEHDTRGNVICGKTESLSPFVIGAGNPTASSVGAVPRDFALHANVPNPFNPTTTVYYDVPTGGAEVSISIYDVSGRLVRELVNERRNAGTWSAQWKGDDVNGQRVASGVYFYRMRAGSFVETKKMVLLK